MALQEGLRAIGEAPQLESQSAERLGDEVAAAEREAALTYLRSATIDEYVVALRLYAAYRVDEDERLLLEDGEGLRPRGAAR